MKPMKPRPYDEIPTKFDVIFNLAASALNVTISAWQYSEGREGLAALNAAAALFFCVRAGVQTKKILSENTSPEPQR